VLLDQKHGFFPYCTRSTTTNENALTLLKESGFDGEVTTHGLLRANATRHGAGPFVTEDSNLHLPSCDNNTGEWQGEFRLGWFDAVAARYALSVCAVDSLVITNLDRINGLEQVKICTDYTGEPNDWYDVSKQSLVKAWTYEESEERTDIIGTLLPSYEIMPGWKDESDTAQIAYIKTLERLLGQPISALSRRKDHRKDYR